MSCLPDTCRFPAAGTIVSIITDIVSTEPKNPIKLRADADPQLAEICLKAMAKTPEARYSTMEDFAKALEEFLQPKPEPKTEPVDQAKPRPEQESRPTAEAPAQVPVPPHSPASPQQPADKAPSIQDVFSGSQSARLEIDSAKEQCEIVRTLVTEGRFDAAAELLEQIAAEKDPALEVFATWAKTELGRLRQKMAPAVRKAGPARTTEQPKKEPRQDSPAVKKPAGVKNPAKAPDPPVNPAAVVNPTQAPLPKNPAEIVDPSKVPTPPVNPAAVVNPPAGDRAAARKAPATSSPQKAGSGVNLSATAQSASRAAGR